jgi:N-methylhydantoinase A
VNCMLDGVDTAAFEARMDAAGREVSAVIETSGIPVERIDVIYELDMHYLGQTHTVAVPLPVSAAEQGFGLTESMIRRAFEQAYSASFSRLLPGLAIRIVSLRVTAVGRRPHFDFAICAPPASAASNKIDIGTRPVWFDGGWRDTRIYARLDLPVDRVIEGPAILEQPDATTVIEPGLQGRVDRLGNLIVERAP